MPSFLSDLRRLSRGASYKVERPIHSDHSSQSVPSSDNQSTSTSNTGGVGSSTPPSTLLSEKSSTTLQTVNGAPSVPQRIPTSASLKNRHSYVSVGSSPNLSASPTAGRSPNPTSPYAPRILSVSDNSWVHQKILLIYGQIGDPAQHAFDGSTWICHHQDSFPAIQWPVCDSHFKALVHLQPGPNRLRLDFVSPKLPSPNGAAAHSSWININYLPLTSSPPLDLVILLGKDSPGTYDAVPERAQREGNGLETAIRKYKMAAYLWEAFTGEQMNRNGFGRRCFRFEEEWQPGTLSNQDQGDSPQMRNEARVHVVRTVKTVAELRDAERAQQNPNGTKKGELFSIAMKAVTDYFNPRPGQTRYVSVLLLDTHWDPKAKLVRGHAALGGGAESVQLAIFGSHALQSYPTCIEEVVPAFTDCTRTDTNYVANDSNESGSNWEAANIGIGAHLHETGHLFGCPHQESGIMKRDYVRFNRTFLCREPFSTRTRSPGQRLCLPTDECTWHRLDCLRFRFHPCFRLPSDMPVNGDGSVQVWPVESGGVLITAATGIAWIEIGTNDQEVCKSHLEYLDSGPPGCPKQVLLTEADLRSRLGDQQKKGKLRLAIFSAGQRKHVIEDFAELVSKSNKVKLPNGQVGFKSSKLGFSNLNNSKPQEVLFLAQTGQRKILTSVRVYHGFALDGVEFIYGDSMSQLFGKRGGKPGGSEFSLDTRRGETILGFYLRAGVWIDGLQIVTSLGRKSEVFGKANGGSAHTLIPPRGYSIVGISGSAGQWVDGFQLIISR